MDYSRIHGLSMDCSRVGEQSLPPALLDTSDSSCAGAEVSTAGVVINSSFNCCIKGCRLIWSGREGVATRPGCQQRSLCCFRSCIPVLCRMWAQVRQLAGSREVSTGEHGRIFKVKDQLLKRSKKLFIIERRTLKTWFVWNLCQILAFWRKKNFAGAQKHRHQFGCRWKLLFQGEPYVLD